MRNPEYIVIYSDVDTLYGTSGKVLTATLAQAGLNPEGVQLRPFTHPGQNPDGVPVLSLGEAAYVHLASLAPKLANGKLSQVRGRRFQHPTLGWVMPTLEPKQIVSSAVSAYTDFRRDILRSVEPLPEPSYILWDVLNPQNALYALHGMHKRVWDNYYLGCVTTPIALDFETGSLDPFSRDIVCMVLGIDFVPGKSVQVFVLPDDTLQDKYVRRALEELWAEPGCALVGHNFKFDREFLLCDGWNVPEFQFDTMLAHYALDERTGGHGLKEVAGEEFELLDDWEGPVQAMLKKLAGRGKNKRTVTYRDVRDASPNLLYEYAAKDVAYTLALRPILHERMREDDVLDYFKRVLVPGANFWSEVELNGLWVDKDTHASLSTEYAKKINSLHAELCQMAGAETFNPNSPDQVRQVLYVQEGVSVPKVTAKTRTKSGKPTTARGAIEKIDHPFVKKLLEYRTYQKLHSTYLTNLPIDSDGRVRTSVSLHGTVTGRMAASEPNLMNIPKRTAEGRRLRSIYAAPLGKVLIEADYAQAELRVLAIMAQVPYLLDIFTRGVNVHKQITTLLFGPDWQDDPRSEELYTWTKNFEFGIIYSDGHVEALQDVIPLPIERLRELGELYYQQMPEVPRYINQVKHQVHAQGFVQSPLGVKRRFPLLLPHTLRDAYKEAVNAPIQEVGSSHMTLLAACQMHCFCREFIPEADVKVLLTVHDSVLVECKDDPHIIQLVGTMLAKFMQDTAAQVMGTQIPFTVDLKVGYTWGKMLPLELEEAA